MYNFPQSVNDDGRCGWKGKILNLTDNLEYIDLGGKLSQREIIHFIPIFYVAVGFTQTVPARTLDKSHLESM